MEVIMEVGGKPRGCSASEIRGLFHEAESDQQHQLLLRDYLGVKDIHVI